MNILLFGCNGQVGWQLQRSLAVLGPVTALDIDSTGHCADFSDPCGVVDTVRALRPDVIVNAAAHTAVDRAESEPERARTLNALTPGALAQEAARSAALFVHYSTDYVFDGSGEQPWRETDPPAPLSVYGHTKLEGEQAVQQSGAQHLIFRTSWVYAARGANFAKTMLRLAQQQERLSVVDDQWGAPTGAELLADITAHAIRQLRQRPQDAGLYHLAAAGATTWHGYASYVLEQARRPSQGPSQGSSSASKIIAREVVPIPASALPTPARRPRNSRLDTHKLQACFGLTLPHWQTGVARMLGEIL